jgi:hypothetical protein
MKILYKTLFLVPAVFLTGFVMSGLCLVWSSVGQKLRKKAWYALLLLSLTDAASEAETSMFHFQAIPQHNGLSKKMAPVDGSRLKPE